jgi:mRNA interferase RelE/StbE
MRQVLRKIRDKNVLKKIKGVIEDVRKADKLTGISHLKKIKTYDTFYRIRIGDYRIGIEATEDEVVIFVRILHRKDVYRYFP